MILKFKEGSGIHIKKKNRGKFTEYCGGKVTNECIQKGKSSSNPAIRKRATFAANARKWKHQQGGTFSNFLTSDKGQMTLSTLSNTIGDITSTIQQNKALKAQQEALKSQYKLEKQQLIANAKQQAFLDAQNSYQQQKAAFDSGNTYIQPSKIVSQYQAYQQNMPDLAQLDSNYQSQQQNINNQKNQLAGNVLSKTFNTIGNTAIQFLKK